MNPDIIMTFLFSAAFGVISAGAWKIYKTILK
jgi:hypothetical protein